MNINNQGLRALALAAISGGLSAFSTAQWFENPPMFPAPHYDGVGALHASIPGLAPVTASNIQLEITNGRVPMFPPGSPTINSFFDVFLDCDLSIGGGTPTHARLQGTGQARGTNMGGGTFDTEMLSMNLSGNSAFGPLMIRESPTHASTGQTHAVPSGGTYHIDSFFDVNTEISIDGGQSWIPTQGDVAPSMRINGSVPEPASFMPIGLGLVAILARRRKK